jgi:hypothetical protein
MQKAKNAQDQHSYNGKLRRLGSHNIAYTIREVWPVILEHITEGKSLMSATKAVNMSYATAMYQLRQNPELQTKYRACMEERGDYLADELVDLSDEMPPPDLDPALINAWVNRQRLRIDARKWSASKLRPKQWGDKIDVSVTHTQISIVQALEQAEARLIDVTDIEPNPPKNTQTIPLNNT